MGTLSRMRHVFSPDKSISKGSVGHKRGVFEVEDTSDGSQKRLKMRDLDSIIRSEAQAGIEGSKKACQDVDESDSKVVDFNANVARDASGNRDVAMACVERTIKLSGKECIEGTTKLPVKECIEGATKLSDKECIEGATKLSSKKECIEGTTKLSGKECIEGTAKLSGKECIEATTKLSGKECVEGATKLSGKECVEGTSKLSGKECVEATTKLSGSCDEKIVCNGLKAGGYGLDPSKRFEDLKVRDDSKCLKSVEETDSMRVWKGLKQHNFMSCAHETAVPIRIPKKRGRKKSSNDDFMKKKTELVKREQVDRFAFLAPPCGLLNGLRPGIISRVRNSKQVLSIIESLVRSERRDTRQSGTLSESNVELESKMLALTISSPVAAVDEFKSCLSTESEGSGNFSSVSEAANVASQWLGLLTRDIKGRLAALGRSKARFFAVITTELPLLISKEFSSNADKGNLDAHIDRWSGLFDRTHKSLCDEETHLESWLNQVNELQMLCERGVYKQRLLGNNTRSGEVENNLEIMAAAASIYSTCKFMSSLGGN